MSITLDGNGAITGLTATGISAVQQLPAGSVIQVVNATYSTIVSSSTNTFIDSGLTATITPKFATSKILVLANLSGVAKTTTSGINLMSRLVRNSTTILSMDDMAAYTLATTFVAVGSVSADYLDSPATTSATTYKVQFASDGNAAVVYVNYYNNISNGSSSTITLMEIAQ